MQIVVFLNKYVFGTGVPIILILLGIFYCFRLKFVHFLHPIKVIKSLFADKKSGGVSSLKAVMLALAGTLGVGNMVGVASAIVLGGFGAVFWMWVSAFVAMILKYAEIVLAIKYRRFDACGKPYGGAMYYIRECFKNSRFGIFIAALFAVFCIFNSLSMGSMIQVRAASDALSGTFGVHPLAVGIGFACVALFALLKGTGGILKITEKLVPLMTLGFAILSLSVIFLRPAESANAFSLIFADAFDFDSGVGGVLGFITSRALRFGTMRGILSNEAGCGTAPAAHAVSNCDIPAKQGVFGIFEVFVDTILLCTLTALVIIVGHGGIEPTDVNFMMVTVNSYTSVLGNFAGYFISLSVMLFGLATVCCWGYYGAESVKYLFSGRKSCIAFAYIYSLSVVFGSVIMSEVIWEMADLAIGAMSFINLSVLLLMSKEVKGETESYFR